jgi:hypothetical protein
VRFVSGDFFGINPLQVGQRFLRQFRPRVPGDPPPGNVPGVTVRLPVGVGLFMNAGKRSRPSANAALQYKVNNELPVLR